MGRKLRLQALEPRVLLDAAGLVDAGDNVENNNSDSGGDANLPKPMGAFMAAMQPDDKAPAVNDSSTQNRKLAEDGSLIISGISVEDATENDTLTLSITLSDDNSNVDPGSLNSILTFADPSGLTENTFANGTLTIKGSVAAINAALDGMQLQPDQDYNGTLTLSLSVSDEAGNAPASPLDVSVSVTPVNDAPELSDTIQVNVDESGTITFGADAFGLTDPDITAGNQVEQQQIIKIQSLPGKGTLTFKGSPVVVGSTFSYDQLSQLVYTHDGSDVAAGDSVSFQVSVNDGAGASDTASVTINLNPINQAPSVNASEVELYEGSTVNLGLDISDRESGHADDLNNATIKITAISGLVGQEGILFIDADGNGVFGAGDTQLSVNDSLTYTQLKQLSYQHNGNEPVEPLTFTLEVTDNGGGEGRAETINHTVELTIKPVDDDPVLVHNNGATVDAGDTVIIDSSHLRVTDVDSPDKRLVFAIESLPDHGELQVKVGGEWKTLTVGSRFTQEQLNNGEVRYKQNRTVSDGEVDQFTFSVRDSAIRPWPVAKEEGAIYDGNDIAVLSFDINIEGDHTGNGGGGNQGDDSETSVNGDNTVDGGLEGGILDITSNDLSYTLKVKWGFPTPADETVYTLTDPPPNGKLQLYVNGEWKDLEGYSEFTQADIDAGNLRFQHDGGEDHVASFGYSVSDGGLIRIEGTVSLDVDPINDKPTASGGEINLIEKTDVTDGISRINNQLIKLGDADGSKDGKGGEGLEDNLWFRIVDLPDDGSLTYWDGDSWEAVQADQWFSSAILSATADGGVGGLRYEHGGGDQSEQLTDSFRFETRDDLSAPANAWEVKSGIPAPAADNLSNTATVNITLAAFNDAPQIPVNPDAADIPGADHNGNPDTAVNDRLTVKEGGSGTIDDTLLNAIDSDNNSIQRQYRITDIVDNGSLKLNGRTLGVGSTFTQADIDAGRLTYVHDGGETHSDSFQFIISDGVSDTAVTTFEINVTSANDFVEVNAPQEMDAFGDSTIDIGGTIDINVDDPDLESVTAGETDELTVTLSLKKDGSAYSDGVLNVQPTGSLSISGNGTGTVTLTGTQADINAALDSLELELADNGNGLDKDTTVQLVITADDRLSADNNQANGGAENEDGSTVNEANNTVSKTVDIHLSVTNDAPEISSPAGPLSVNEDTEFTFTGGNLIQVSDADAFDKTIEVTLSVTSGTLSLSDTGLISAGANDSASITLSGTQSAINAALAGLSYQGVENFNGSDSLNVTVNDKGNAGTGGEKTDSVSIAIDVEPVNDAPVLVVPDSPLTIDDSNPLPFNGTITVSEPADNRSGHTFTDDVSVTLTLTDATGILTQKNGTQGTGSLTITGTLDYVNDQLNGLTYKPSNDNLDNTVTLTVEVDDQGNGESGANAKSVDDTITINVSSVNDGVTVDASDLDVEVDEDSSIEFTTGDGNAIVISDTDDFGGDITVTLTATKGVLNVSALQGVTISGNDSDTLTLTGSKANLNQILNGLTYTPDANYHGSATITVNANDNGNTGVGTGSDSKTINVTVDPVNDQPVASNKTVTVGSVAEDSGDPAGTELYSLLIGEYSDNTDNQTANGGGNTETDLSYVAIFSNGSNSDQGVWQVSYVDGGGVTHWVDIPVSLSANKAVIVPASASIRFVPAADFHGNPGQLKVKLADNSAVINDSIDETSGQVTLKKLKNNGGTGETDAWSKKQVKIKTTVTNVNDSPEATGNAQLTAINEDNKSAAGSAVSDLFGSLYSDATDDQSGITGGGDASSALGGIAIVGNDADPATEGKWQYDTGSGWADLPSISGGNGFVLANDAKLRFVPVDDFNGTPGSLDVRLSDADVGAGGSLQAISGDQWSNTIQLNTEVNPRNDAPELQGTAANPSLSEKNNLGDGTDSVYLISSGTAGASDIDASNASFGGGTITVKITSGLLAGDTLSIQNGLTGVASQSYSNGVLTIQLNADATEANVGDILESISYRSTSDNPTNFGNNTSRGYEVSLNDGNNNGTAGGPAALDSTNKITGTITITPVNDNPIAYANQDEIFEDAENPVTGNVITDANTQSEVDYDPDNPTSDLTVSTVKDGVKQPDDSFVVQGDFGTLTVNPDGSYSYNLDSSLDAVQQLNQGETTTDVFEYTITDGDLSSNSVSLTITIKGVNDPSVISVGAGDSDSGAVTEDVDNDAGTAGIQLEQSGTLTVTDADTSDTAAFNPAGTVLKSTTHTEQLGTLSIKADGSWDYSVDNSAVQFLDANESITEVYTVTAVDGTSHDITIVIHGANDASVISVGAGDSDSGAVTEDVDSDAGTAGIQLEQSGTLTVTDADTSDTAAFNPAATVLKSTTHNQQLGTLNIKANGSWDYSVDNSAVQFLDANESITEVYTVTAVDGTSHDITIVIHGANDASVISVGAGNSDSGAVTEDVDNDAGTAGIQLEQSGTLTVTDADTSDTAAFDPAATVLKSTTHNQQLGTLNIKADGSWDYSVDNSEVQFLDANESITEVYTVTAVDGTSHDITIVIHGANDASEISVGAGDSDSGAVTEDVDNDAGTAGIQLEQSGTLTVTDADTSDTAAFDPAATVLKSTTHNQQLGTLNIKADGSWDYSVDNSEVQFLDANESITEVYTVTAVDGTSHDITIVIHGANDASVISVGAGDSDRGTVTEDVDNDAGTAGIQLEQSGTLTVTDADTSDTAAFDPAATVLKSTTHTQQLGTLSIKADGSWDFSVDNSEIQFLGTGESITEVYTVRSIDGITHDITITINGINDTPVVVTEQADQTNTDGGTVSLDVITGSFSDIDASDSLAYSISGLPAGLSFDPATGLVSGIIDNSASQINGGVYTVTLTATDKQGAQAQQSFTWAVTNLTPISSSDSGSVTEDTAPVHTGNVLANDGDSAPDSDDLSVSNAGTIVGDYGTLELNADGSYTYTLNNDLPAVQVLAVGETLTDTFGYQVSDGEGGNSSSNLTITINGTNDAILAFDNSATVAEDQVETATGNVLTDDNGFGVDRDLDGDDLTVSGVNGSASGLGEGIQGTYGRLFLNPDGSYRYELDNNSNAVQALAGDQRVEDVFTYTVTDGNGSEVSARLIINVEGLDEPYVAPETPSNPPGFPDFEIPGEPGDEGEPGTGGDGTGETDGLFGGFSLDFFDDPRRNPVSLSVLLQDQVVTEGIYRFSIPSNAFEHTDPSQPIFLEASLSDGSQLPDYVQFDNQSGVFVIYSDDARQLEIEGLDIRVTGRDQIGNEASSTFHIAFAETFASENFAAENFDPNLLEAPASGEEPEVEAENQEEVPEQKLEEGNSESDSEQKEQEVQENVSALSEQLKRASESGFVQNRDRLMADLLSLAEL